MDFRIPHPFENIGDAIKDALNPDSPADGSLVTQLMNENNRAIEDAMSNLGVVGAYELSTITGVDVLDRQYVTFTPTGNTAYLTSVRVWTQDTIPTDAILSCVLDGYSSGVDRGYRHDQSYGAAFACGDIGVTASGIEAVFSFEWSSADPTPPTIDFSVEIISVPFTV